MSERPGYYQGHHYTAYVDQVKMFECQGQLDQAEQLLLKLIEVIEAENEAEHFGVAPWYYKELAKIYRLRNNGAAARAIIDRFHRQPYGTQPLYRTSFSEWTPELVSA